MYEKYFEYYDKIINHQNPTNLQCFKIYKLFGRYNVNLRFDKEVNIYIGENGLGKTTILNCLYFALSKNFSQLANIDFEKIQIGFKNNRPFEITKSDLISYNKIRTNHFSRYDTDEIFEELFSELNLPLDVLRQLDESSIDSLIRRVAQVQGIPLNIVKRLFYDYLSTRQNSKYNRTKGNPEKVKTFSKAVNENVLEKVIYLPTYRRIENDFSDLRFGSSDKNSSELLIRFGMSDVQKSMDQVLDKIRNLAVQGYNKLTGSLLEQYTKDDSLNFKSSNKIDIRIVKIMMDRLGDKIDKHSNNRIIELIESGDIYNTQYVYLLNLLQMLISNYDIQKHYDDRINSFVDTCNKYFNDKYFYYNPSELTLEIYLNDSPHNIVHLTQLSSGEKQIVSLFSKLYLEDNDKNIIIIDEPELSLSIKWQQMLLPDIMRSKNCSLLLTVTHSPFIFENEFDMDAEEIRAHIDLQ